MKRSIENLRQDYGNNPLIEGPKTPMILLKKWVDEAIEANIYEPNAMNLATVGLTGRVTSRMVLLKKISQQGLVFFSSAQSRKAQQISQVPFVALTFYWPELHRQIRIEGVIHMTPRKIAQTYFYSRPRGAQIAASISCQSAPIESREELLKAYQDCQSVYEGKEIPCPKDWVGYEVIGDRYEFWQGQSNRLHDRIVYIKDEDNWMITRLAP